MSVGQRFLYRVVSAVVWMANLAAQIAWMPTRDLGPIAVEPRIVYDPVRGRAVCIGEGTWEWVDHRWLRRSNEDRPGRLFEPGLAWDGIGSVAFGGKTSWGSNAPPLDDTWRFDGEAWTQIIPAQRPSARWAAAMSWDPIRERVVLFGGEGSSGTLADTWLWDGVSWQLQSTPTPPSARSAASIGWLATHQVMILFGGQSGAVPLNDTWRWDGASWLSVSPAVSPTARYSAPMTADPRGRVLLSGGEGASGYLWETWTFDGATWRPAGGVIGQRGHALVFDPVENRCLRFGGEFETYLPPLSENIHEWDGTTWTARAAPTWPMRRHGHAMVHDPVRDRMLLLCGRHHNPRVGLETLNDHWEWNGVAWRYVGDLRTLRGPPGRHHMGLAFDAVQQRAVLFGGWYDEFFEFGDTWEWDGLRWTQRVVAGAPAPRGGHAMAWDLLRQRIVLFGGGDTQGTVFDDTWEWNGAAWQLRQPAHRPGPRFGAAMAFDVVHGSLLLFGGEASPSTWAFDGVDWRQHLSQTLPPRRDPVSLCSDIRHSRVLLVTGGAAEVWAWDGADWAQLLATRVPGLGHDYAVAFDTHRDRLVGYSSDTWVIGDLTPATVQVVGVGCGHGALPGLVGSSPFLGNSACRVDLLHAAASAPAIVVVSPIGANTPLGAGCTAFVGATAEVFFLPTNSGGFASLRLAVPNDLTLRGVVLWAQAAVLDSQGPLGGVALTAGLRLTFGD